MIKNLIPAIVLFTLASPAVSQELNVQDHNETREQITRTGMYVLGSWALLNIATGSAGYFRASGSDRYFYQMNAFWNTVNLGLAGITLLSAAEIHQDLSSTVAAQQKIEKLLLFNAGLDVGYTALGFYLRERSRRGTSRSDRYKGYGNSLILQGSFLFAFDVVLYAVLNNHGSALYDFMEHVQVGAGTVGFRYRF